MEQIRTLERLGLHYEERGHNRSACKCYLAALRLVMPASVEAQIRLRLGLLLTSTDRADAFEHLQRAFRLSAETNYVFKTLALSGMSKVGPSQLVQPLLMQLIDNCASSVNWPCAVLAFYSSLRASSDVNLIYLKAEQWISAANVGGYRAEAMQMTALLFLHAVAHGLGDHIGVLRQVCVDMIGTCPTPIRGLLLYLFAVLSAEAGHYAETEEYLKQLLELKLDAIEICPGLTLFKSSFKFVVKAMCIVQSAVDGKQPYEELYYAIDKVAARAPSALKPHFVMIKACLLLGTGRPEDFRVEAEIVGNDPRFPDPQSVFSKDCQRRRTDSPHASSYAQFSDAVRMALESAPQHRIKASLLSALRTVSSTTQDASLRAIVMLALSKMYETNDAEMAGKMRRVALAYATALCHQGLLKHLAEE